MVGAAGRGEVLARCHATCPAARSQERRPERHQADGEAPGT